MFSTPSNKQVRAVQNAPIKKFQQKYEKKIKSDTTKAGFPSLSVKKSSKIATNLFFVCNIQK